VTPGPGSRTRPVMGTTVTIEVVDIDDAGRGAGSRDIEGALDRAFRWFDEVEAICSRFDPASELRQLSERAVGRPVEVSHLLYAALEFALAVAEESEGAFDPTVGHELEARGFAHNYRNGTIVAPVSMSGAGASFRDVRLDRAGRTVALTRPLILDLGAVAKGLAVDLAVRELQPCTNFAIDAGGDLYLGGRNGRAEPWTVGIRHPRLTDRTIATIHVTDMAVCTSGDYERRQVDGAGHHLVDPRTGTAAADVASVTVVAASAMLADALGTAAFVLGAVDGLRWLEAHDVEGLILSTSLQRFATKGMRDGAVLSNA